TALAGATCRIPRRGSQPVRSREHAHARAEKFFFESMLVLEIAKIAVGRIDDSAISSVLKSHNRRGMRGHSAENAARAHALNPSPGISYHWGGGVFGLNPSVATLGQSYGGSSHESPAPLSAHGKQARAKHVIAKSRFVISLGLLRFYRASNALVRVISRLAM
ncbi:hypothetical protein KXV46_006824, partial [Aspergillus fumigatus]